MAHAEPLPYASQPDAVRLPDVATAARRVFWRRAIALVIDLAVLSLIDMAVNAVFGVTHVTSGSPIPLPGSDLATFTNSTGVGWGWLTVIWLVYFIGLEALFGATVGKGTLGLRVTDLTGARAGFWAIVLRNVARLVDSLPVLCLVGGSVAVFSSRRQRLGDHLARTVVVRRDALPAPLLTAAQVNRRAALVATVLVAWLAVSAMFFYYGRPPLVVQSMMNTRQMMFGNGVSSYTLSAPVWASDTVTYQITYVTEQPVDTCHARLTLVWAPPTGWEPRYGTASCATHTP